ncbi:MAG: TIGR03000 domain-containing protein [Gemmataceae bacterium]
MLRRLSFLLGSTILSATVCSATADAHGGGGGHGGSGGGHGAAHGGFHNGGYHNGGYHNGGYGFYGPYRSGLYAPYGFYRPYYGYGLGGYGLGFGGLGLGMGGLGMGGYGMGGYGLGGYGMGGYGLGGYGMGGYGGYQPYYGGVGGVIPGVVAAPPGTLPANGAGVQPQTPPPDNAAHLQLTVPPNAEVLFDGGKTTQIGATREFVSPKLPTGKLFDYTITVRYNDANGKTVTDKRVIHVRANDWFRIDFTRPAPQEPPVP